MMRKFNKKKGSKRGAILVTVVFILAFAVIFIAAAMTLTQATRRRVYTEAESNQARLTVTSVAEAWYRAVDKCEFTDKALLAYFKANSGSGTTIRVKASANASNVPGLETEGQPNSTVSYTTMKLYRSPNVVGASKDEEYTYFADFSTYIDGQIEHVRAEMSYTPQSKSGDGGPFSTQIDLYGKFGNNNLEVVGDGKDADDLDNIFLVRNGGNNTDSGFSSYATMIYCDGTVTFKDEVLHSEDVVFLTGAKLKGEGDSGHYSSSSKVKNIFFFGDNGEDMFSGAKGNFSGSGINFYYYKRTNNNTAYTSGGNVIEIKKDGTRADGASTSDAFKKKVQAYAAYNDKYKKGGSEQFPTTDEFLASTTKTLKIAKTAPSSAKEMTLGKFLTDYNFKTYKNFAPSGTYLFKSDDSDHSLKKKNPIVIVLEGGQDYRFYFKSNQTFGLHGVVFIIHKPDKANPALFLLESGAKINWPGDGSGTTSNYDERVGDNGIFAVEGRNFDSAQKAYDYIMNITAKTPRQFEAGNGKDYSTKYNGKNEPCAMIIGMAKNEVSLDKCIVMEAFVGLFNSSYNPNSTQSTLSFRNNDSGVMYGRIMTDGLGFSNDSGSIKYPASPASSSISPTPPDIEPIITGFALKSMKYYYNL